VRKRKIIKRLHPPPRWSNANNIGVRFRMGNLVAKLQEGYITRYLDAKDAQKKNHRV
jgi:hypothetical protein